MPVSTILLLPHADTRERLLAPGAPVCDKVLRVFGWVVPTPSGNPHPSGWIDSEADTLGLRRLPVDADSCLVLARDGAEVYEGTDRLRRIIGAEKSVGFLTPPEVPPELHEAYRLVRYAEWAGLGAAVLVDSDGHEVTP